VAVDAIRHSGEKTAMTQRRLFWVRYLLAGHWRRMAVHSYGDPAAPPVLCVHGLTRTGRDFDALAQALSHHHYVISPDLPGRGESDWLPDPLLYAASTYITALSYLMARLDSRIDYIGTSLGGICGMELAAMPENPIRRLVLNDVGPLVPREALERIRDYLTAPPPRFANPQMLKLYLRRVHAPFGPLTDAQWLTLAENSARKLPNGDVALHYDPQIAELYAANTLTDLDMWHWWNAIDIPTLTLRGEFSDVLPKPVFDQMAAKSQTREIPNTGHAPALLDAPTIEVVRGFLDEAA
jgi:pimeloyl-ACP methyl ester carboxylesterase